MTVAAVSRCSYVDKVLLLIISFSPHIAHCLRLNVSSNGEPQDWATYAEMSALRNSLSKGALFPRQSYQASNKTIAVFLTGLQKNMLVESKLKFVVEPARAEGWDVDVFMEIAGLGTGSGVAWEHFGDLTTEDFVRGNTSDWLSLFEENLNMRGARLVHGLVRKTDYNVTGDLEAGTNLRRMMHYNPFSKTHKREAAVGQNVLKRFKGLQRLMTIAAAIKDYDFVLVTRDTDLWLRELDLSVLPNPTGSTVFTKACKTWNGVNDKTFLFSGDAAKSVLLHVYDDFFNETYHVLDNTKNAEEFWHKLITQVHGVQSLPIRPASIPTVDAFWRFRNGSKEICVNAKYRCQGDLLSERTMPMC